MLIVSGTLTIDPADAPKLAAAATTMMAETLKETGCHQYVFSQSMADPSKVQIFEMWQSDEELAAHFEMPHMADFRGALADVNVTSREIYKYEVDNMSKL